MVIIKRLVVCAWMVALCAVSFAAGSNVRVDKGGIHYFLSDHQFAPAVGFSSSVVSGSVRKSTATGISTLSFSWKDDQGVIRSATWKGQITYDQSYFSQGGVDYWVMSDGFFKGYLLLIISCDMPTGESAFSRVACRPGKVGSVEDITIPVEWQKARTLTGLWEDMCSGSEGVVQIKCGKANRKGMAKVSMTVTPFVSKKRTYGAVSVDVSSGGEVTVVWPQQKFSVAINGDDFSGHTMVSSSGDSLTCLDSVWSAPVGGEIPDGEYRFASESVMRYWVDDPAWIADALEDSYGYCMNLNIAAPLLRSQRCMVRRGRIDFGKTSRPAYKLVNGELMLTGLLETKPNYSATKLTYSAKTGLFKGSFTAYTDPVVCVEPVYPLKRASKLKTYSFTVSGVYTGHMGRGYAICKKKGLVVPVRFWDANMDF